MLELEEWDRIHTLPLVSFVHDDSPEEAEIGMAIQRGVIDVEEGLEDVMVPWGVDARTGMLVIPLALHFPVEMEEDGEGEHQEKPSRVLIVR